MELIKYRKTLDVHKNGVQFTLQGFQTADNMSRVIEINLMASGDAIDFPLERIVAMMYVTTPSAKEPSINECTIKDNKVVYNVLPIVEEGITTMRLKLIETSPEGAKRVLASPEFAVEVSKSNAEDDGAELKTTFTAIEDFIAKADAAYGSRLERIELASDCIFKAYYYDGTIYETDVLQKLFLNGNVLLSESFAHGGTGVRAGEDTDNSKYYSNVSKSESLNAKAIMEDSKEILEEVKLHGVYTAFSVDFTTGKVEYVSPSFDFKVNKETGELDVEGQSYTFEEEIYRVVNDWLTENNVVLTDLRAMIGTIEANTLKIGKLQEDYNMLEKRVTPIKLGGTGATTKEEAIVNLGIDKYQKPWNVDGYIGAISPSSEVGVFPGSEDCEKVEENTLPIYMKNSGQLYVSFNCTTGQGVNCALDVGLKIYINDELYKSYITSDFTQVGEGVNLQYRLTVSRLLLTVKKGDIVTFKIEGKQHSIGYGSSARCTIEKLEANVETPYIYMGLTEGTDEITATDILNALTGGAE